MLSDDTWSDAAQESALTKPLAKMQTVLSEATTVGAGEAHNMCEVWVAGLQHSNVFMKLFREYVKSKRKYEKMRRLTPHL